MPRSLPPFAVQLAAVRGGPIPSFLPGLHGRLGDRVYKAYRRPRGQVRLVVTRVPDFSGYTPNAANASACGLPPPRRSASMPTPPPKPSMSLPRTSSAFRLAISDHLAGRVRVPEAALISPQITESTQPPTDHAGGYRAGGAESRDWRRLCLATPLPPSRDARRAVRPPACHHRRRGV